MYFFSEFYVLQTPLLTGSLCDSEKHDTSLDIYPCTYGSGVNGSSVLYLLSAFVKTLVLCLGVFLGSSSMYGVNHVSMRSIFYGVPLCCICCTRTVQLVGIVSSLINGTFENSYSTNTWNLGET